MEHTSNFIEKYVNALFQACNYLYHFYFVKLITNIKKNCQDVENTSNFIEKYFNALFQACN